MEIPFLLLAVTRCHIEGHVTTSSAEAALCVDGGGHQTLFAKEKSRTKNTTAVLDTKQT